MPGTVSGQQQSSQENTAVGSAPVSASPSTAVPSSSTYGPPAPAVVLNVTPPGIDPQLARAADLAIDRYPSIAAAEALVRATDQDVRAAQWLRAPSGSVSMATRGTDRKSVV